MTTGLSLGPVVVTDASVTSINDALRQLQERIDALKGLGGDVTIHSAHRVVDDDGNLIHALGTAT